LILEYDVDEVYKSRMIYDDLE